MSEYASFEELTTTNVGELTRDVPIGGGKAVQVRALTRYELMLVMKNGQQTDANEAEQEIMSYGLVQPKLSKKQIEAWQKSIVAGDRTLVLISNAIKELSGLVEGADKSDLSDV